MDMTEYETWHTDEVSLAILSTISAEDLESVASNLVHETGFMEKWGPFASNDPDIERIEVHAWARHRVIARAVFASGAVYADSTIVTDKPLPATVLQAIAGDLVERHVPHRCFRSVRFDAAQEDGSSLRIDLTSRFDLGRDPGRRLSAIVTALAE